MIPFTLVCLMVCEFISGFKHHHLVIYDKTGQDILYFYLTDIVYRVYVLGQTVIKLMHIKLEMCP